MIVLENEIKKIKKALNYTSDLVERRLSIEGRKVALIYLDGMIDVKTVDLGLVEPLLSNGSVVKDDISMLEGVVETSEKLEFFTDRKQALEKVLTGSSLIIFDGANGYAVCSAQGFLSRPIMEPPVSSVIKGPR